MEATADEQSNIVTFISAVCSAKFVAIVSAVYSTN